VDVANNGQEALDILAQRAYDGVLLDIQMPVMDGYTTAVEIRKQEQFATLPVIAMTANAMVGDREKALAAGMNDHVAKPLNVADMFATISRWVTPAKPQRAPAQTGTAPQTTSIPAIAGVDIARGLATCGGNVELYQRLLSKFHRANRDFESLFADALAAAEPDEAARAAHTLKGVAGNIGAGQIAAAAGSLESACEEQRGDEIQAALRNLLSLLAPTLKAIEGLEFESAEKPTQPAPDAQSALRSLRELLEDADVDAEEVARELLPALGSAEQRRMLEQLILQVEAYDFDRALEYLAELEYAGAR